MKTEVRFMGRIVTILITLLAISGFAAAVTLFVQWAPAIPQTGLVSMCSTLTAPSNIASIEPGFIIFTCGYWGHAIHSFPNATATPYPANYAPYLNTSIFPVTSSLANITACVDIGGVILLEPAVPVLFPAEFMEWNYCVEHGVVSLTGLPAFPITWKA